MSCTAFGEWEDETAAPLEVGAAFMDPTGELLRCLCCPVCGRELFSAPVSCSGLFYAACYKCKRTFAYEIRPTGRKIGFTSDFSAAEAREGAEAAASACARRLAPPGRRKR